MTVGCIVHYWEWKCAHTTDVRSIVMLLSAAAVAAAAYVSFVDCDERQFLHENNHGDDNNSNE